MDEIVDGFIADSGIVFQAVIFRPIHNGAARQTIGAIREIAPGFIMLHNIRIRELRGLCAEKHPRQEEFIAGVVKCETDAEPFIVWVIVL